MANKVSYLIILQDRFSRQAGKITRASQKVVRAMQKIEGAAKKADKRLKAFAASSKKVSQKMAEVGALVSVSAVPALGFNKSVEQSVKMQVAMSGLARIVRTSDFQFSDFGGTLRKINGQLLISMVRFTRTGMSLADFAAASKKAGKQIAKVGAVILAMSIAPLLGFKASVVQSVKMEDAMSNIARVVKASDSQLSAFEKTLEKMSEQLGKSKIGLAQMAFEGGKLGTSLKDMEPFLLMVSKTAIAFDLQDEEAGRAIGSIRAKMGLMNDDTQTLLDSVNFLADTTSASGARMINIIERVSGTMSLLKIPPQAVAALAGFSDQLEVSSELAASGLNLFINRMTRFPGMTTKLMNKPLETIRSVLVAIAKMGPEVQAKVLGNKGPFGDEAGRFVKKMVANIKLFDKSVTNALSPAATGSMQRELESQLRRSSKTFERFAQTATNSLDAIGDAIKPLIVSVAKFLTPIIDGIGKLAKENPKIVKFAFVFTVVTAAVGALSFAIGGLLIAVGFITVPILLAAAAFGLLVAAGFLLVENWEDMKGGARALWRDVVAASEKMAKSFITLKLVILAVGVAFGIMFSPILLIVAAIGLLVVAGIMVVKNWEGIKGGAQALWETVSGFFSRILASAVTFGSDLIDIFMSPITFLTDKISGLGDKISSLFSFGTANVVSLEVTPIIADATPVVNAVLKFSNTMPKVTPVIADAAPVVNAVLKFSNTMPKVTPIIADISPEINMGLIKSINSKIATVGRDTASLFSFNETEFEVKQSVMQKSQTDINVNLRAPAGVIESVKSKTTGNLSGLNMGVNVQAAG